MRLYTYDLETEEWDSIISASAVCNDGREWYWDGPGADAELVALMRAEKGTWIAHAGGRFDLPLLLDGAPDLIDGLILSGSTILRGDGAGRLKIRDSFPLTLASLKKLGEWVGLEKLEVDRTRMQSLTPSQLREYNLRDCQILLKVVEEIRAWTEATGARAAWTAGALAVNLWQTHEPDAWREACRHRVHVDEQHRATGCIRGGRVECFARGRVEGPIYCYDIKSSYPARYQEGPVGFGARAVDGATTRKLLDKGWPSLARASWSKSDRMRIAPVLDALTLAGAGRCEAWISTAEYRTLLDSRDVARLEIQEGWVAKVEIDAGATFASWCYGEKERGVPWGKLAVNALHGKTGERPLKSQWTRGEVPASALLIPAPRKVGDWSEFYEWGCDTRGLCPPHAQPLMAGTILGRARAALSEGMRAVQSAGGFVYYCDTDSIHCDLPPDRFPLKMGGALGEWEMEAVGSEAIYLVPKSYAIQTPVGLKAACKGINFGALRCAIVEPGDRTKWRFREAREGEEGSDLRWEFFGEALRCDAEALREGISTFATGLHRGTWSKSVLVRRQRPTGKGKQFGTEPTCWAYLSPTESRFV